MYRYKIEVDKMYKKISSIAKKGQDGIFDYYNYVDEIINNKLYSVYEDVLVTKFGIDFLKYKSVNEMKSKTFSIIRKYTTTKFQDQLKQTFDKYGLYAVGLHFYDSSTNRYLGDIIEDDISTDWIMYKDSELTRIQPASQNGEIKIIQLIANVGSPTGLKESIPPFPIDEKRTFSYNLNSMIYWNDEIYKCSTPYTWSKDNNITPDNLNYWMVIYPPSYNSLTVSDETVPLLDKYVTAINFLKSFNYTDLSENLFVESNFMDDYFE
jgi:hypothetical protein